MANLDQGQLAQIVAAVIQALQVQGVASPKPSHFLPKGSKASADDLAGKDQRLIAAFTRKGFRNVVLMDRNDPSKDFNVRPYRAWLEVGRVVRKGQHGVKGLFHITQTDPLPAKAQPKPGITAETKAVFDAAKKALRAKKAKLQPVT